MTVPHKTNQKWIKDGGLIGLWMWWRLTIKYTTIQKDEGKNQSFPPNYVMTFIYSLLTYGHISDENITMCIYMYYFQLKRKTLYNSVKS